MSPEPHSVLGLGRMGNKDKDGKDGSVTLFNHADISRSDADKNSMLVSSGARCSGGEIFNALGFCSFHGTFAAISGAIFKRDKQQHGRRQTAAA